MRNLEDHRIKLRIGIGASSPELMSFIHRVLPAGSGLETSGDYTASRSIRRLPILENVRADAVDASLVLTFQDDNIGWVPQVAGESIHVLLEFLVRQGWNGYTMRFWPIGDLDPVAAYLSAASWASDVSPATVYKDHFTHVYGEQSVSLFCQAMRLLEDATVILDLDFLSLLFPVPHVVANRVASESILPEGLFHILAQYESVRLLLKKIVVPEDDHTAHRNLAYWIARLEFAIGALKELNMLHQGGVAMHAARQALEKKDFQTAADRCTRAAALYEQAIQSGEEVLRIMAKHIRDDSDSTSVITYYHLMVRQVRERVRSVLDEVRIAE